MTMEYSRHFVQFFIYISLIPFLHGLPTEQYFSFYTIPHLMRIFVIELLMLSTHIWIPKYAFVIPEVLFPIFCYIIIIANYFDLYTRMSWTIRFFFQHTVLRIICNQPFEILMHLVDVIRLSWISKLPVNLRIIYVFCNIISLGIYISVICLHLLSNTFVPAMLLKDTIIKPEINKQNKEVKTYPFNKTHMTLSRFLGEDVLMTCKSQIQGDNNPAYSLIWTHNENTVQPSHRHIFSSRILQNNNISYLSIVNITAADYGHYRCNKRINKQTKDVTIKTIILVRYVEHITKEHIKIGAVISLENMFWFHIIQNTTQNLTWQHTVNDNSFNEVCRDGISIYAHIHNRMKYQSPTCVASGNVFKCNFSMNICERAFGLHKFAVVKTNKDNINETVYHPRQIMILPKDKIYMHLPLTLIREKGVLLLLQAKELLEFPYFALNIITFGRILIFCLILYSTDTLCNIIFLVFDYLRDGTSRLGILTILNILKKKHKYDVFVSCCDEDNGFVLQTIIPLLENQLNLRVCWPDRDINSGHPLTEYGKCINLSKRILVILSDSYVQEPDCNQMQFSTFIMPQLWSREKSLRDVLLLPCSPCEVPPIYSELLTVTNWLNHQNIDTLKDEIEQWMEDSEPSNLGKFSEILLYSLAILMR